MHRGYLVAVLLFACQAFAWADRSYAIAENAVSAASAATPAGKPGAQTKPVIDRIRSKLSDAGLRGNDEPADVASLESFYGSSTSSPLWLTYMCLSARGQSSLFEIERANDWGLDAAAFELPPAFNLPRSVDEEALAEIKLDLAIL